jgi:superkiller protein 3
VYSSPCRSWLVLAGVVVVFQLGCQESTQLNPTLGNLPQQPLNSKEPEINASTYFAHGHLLERQGQFDRAAKQYERSLALRPEFLSARNRLGITLNKLGRHAEASLQFERALASYPTKAYLYNNLGFSLYLENRYEEAEAALARALDLQPDFARAHMNRALTLARLDRLDEAFTELKLANSEPDAYFNMGVMLIDVEKYDEAGPYFEAALALRPDFDAARVQLQEATRLAAVAQARQAALALITEPDAAEELPAEAFVDESGTEPQPTDSGVEVAIDTTDEDLTGADDTTDETWDSAEPEQPIAAEPVTPDEPIAAEPLTADEPVATSEPESSETIAADVPPMDEETPEPWETAESDPEFAEEDSETSELEFADAPPEDPDFTWTETDATDVSAGEETEFVVPPEEMPLSDASAEPGAWDGVDMVWLDYTGSENVADPATDPPAAATGEQTAGTEFAQDPDVDAELLLTMIDEAIADLENEDHEAFEALWCRIGYYLFPETAPEGFQPGSDLLADESDSAEVPPEPPVGK